VLSHRIVGPFRVLCHHFRLLRQGCGDLILLLSKHLDDLCNHAVALLVHDHLLLILLSNKSCLPSWGEQQEESEDTDEQAEQEADDDEEETGEEEDNEEGEEAEEDSSEDDVQDLAADPSADSQDSLVDNLLQNLALRGSYRANDLDFTTLGKKAKKAKKAKAKKPAAKKKKAKKAPAKKKKKAKKVSKIAKGKLAKYLVFKGKKEKTKSGAKKSDLMKGYGGKIVSKKASAASKKKLGGWLAAVAKARKALGTKGFVAIKKGSALYTKAKSFYKR